MTALTISRMRTDDSSKLPPAKLRGCVKPQEIFTQVNWQFPDPRASSSAHPVGGAGHVSAEEDGVCLECPILPVHPVCACAPRPSRAGSAASSFVRGARLRLDITYDRRRLQRPLLLLLLLLHRQRESEFKIETAFLLLQLPLFHLTANSSREILQNQANHCLILRNIIARKNLITKF